MKWHLKHAVFGNKPRAVQVEASKRAAGRPRYGQFLEQRLGKTPLTLNEFMTSEWDIMPVIAPNSFKLDWALAPAEWGLSNISVGVWPRDPLPHKAEKAVYAMNYEAARSEGGKQLMKLLKDRSCLLTIDESSAIKNPQSDTARALINMSKYAKGVRELNGTPMTQNVLDYYPQLRVLGELNGIEPLAFRNQFAIMGGYMGRQITGFRNEDKLFEILDRCSFRALRKDWLPGHREPMLVPVHLEMTNKQHDHYKEMMDDFFTIVNGLDVSAEIVLTQMDKLRQISSCLAMSYGNVQWIEEPKHNPKIKAVLDIHGAGSGKTIVVYYYKPSGEALFKSLTANKLNPAVIKGGMAPEDIVRAKERFNQDPDCRALIGQQTAACMGHTLTGPADDRCDRMVFYENSFNLRDRLQMSDRNYYDHANRGIYDLVTSPMDQIVVDTLSGKKDMADAVDKVVAAVRSSRIRG